MASVRYLKGSEMRFFFPQSPLFYLMTISGNYKILVVLISRKL